MTAHETACGTRDETTVIVLPPYGDEPIGLALGAAIAAGGKHMEDQETTSGYRETRRGRTAVGADVAKFAGIIVIAAVVILALQVGGLKGLVQH